MHAQSICSVILSIRAPLYDSASDDLDILYVCDVNCSPLQTKAAEPLGVQHAVTNFFTKAKWTRVRFPDIQDFSYLHSVQIASGAHATSSPIDIKGAGART
jgi:hypothetical protein